MGTVDHHSSKKMPSVHQSKQRIDELALASFAPKEEVDAGVTSAVHSITRNQTNSNIPALVQLFMTSLTTISSELAFADSNDATAGSTTRIDSHRKSNHRPFIVINIIVIIIIIMIAFEKDMMRSQLNNWLLDRWSIIFIAGSGGFYHRGFMWFLAIRCDVLPPSMLSFHSRSWSARLRTNKHTHTHTHTHTLSPGWR